MKAQEKAREIAEMLWSGDDMNGDIIRGVAVTAAHQMHEWTKEQMIRKTRGFLIEWCSQHIAQQGGTVSQRKALANDILTAYKKVMED